jgi:putative transposase
MLNVNRSSIYKAESISSMISDAELELRGQVDRLHTDHPTWGYRMISDALRLVGKWINRKKVRRIMRDMSIYAIYPKPNLSKRYHAAHIRPYLLRKLAITEPDQVWGVDITYVHFPKGFMYLFVIIDWYSRCIVDYGLSGTLDKRFVMECLRRAMSDRKPQIINSDQGSHFTNPNYLRLMEEHGVRISMDGKGQCRDNARTERFFRTLKYDTVYIQEVDSPRDLRAMFDKYIPEYNTNRPHSSLGGRTPAEVYFGDSKEYVA